MMDCGVKKKDGCIQGCVGNRTQKADPNRWDKALMEPKKPALN